MRPPVAAEQVEAAFDDALADAAGVDELELCLLGRAAEYTRFAGDRIHQPQDVTETQYLVRAVVDGRTGRAATTVLRGLSAAVRSAAESAGRAARRNGSGRVRLAGPQDAARARELALWSRDVESFDAVSRSVLAQDAMRRAAAAGALAAGMFGRAVTQQIVSTSTGIRRSVLATEASAGMTVQADDGSAHWIDVGRSAERLALPAAVSATIARAESARRPVVLPPGVYQVVLAPEAMCELIQFLPRFGFLGTAAAAGIGLCAESAGRRVAAASVDVADDATADVGLPISFDIEGVRKRRVPFLEQGVVGEPVTDLATAQMLGRGSTGHAHIAREEVPGPEAANIVMSAGQGTEADLIAAVSDGVYIQRFWYTRVVDETHATITGVTRDACFRIRAGALAEPIAGMRFTESVLDVLAAVDDVAADRRSVPTMNVWNGAATAPAVRSHHFRLGVKQEAP